MENYARTAGLIRFTISTDWDTRESFRLTAPFRLMLNGKVFTEQDWKRIEQSPGKVKPGMRATVWVCEGKPHLAVLDWQPPRK